MDDAITDLGSTMEPPTEAEVKELCQPGTEQCCRYLTMSGGVEPGKTGWSCAKLTRLSMVIDMRVDQGTFRATGDNCPGKGSR